MISSFILLALVELGTINADKGLGFLKVYFIGLAFEVVVDIIIIPKIMDKIDAWRKNNDSYRRTKKIIG